MRKLVTCQSMPACERSVNQCLHKDYLIKQTTKLSAFLTDIVFIIHSAIDFN